MEEISETCRRVEKHKYWTEFEPEKHQFFKIMIGDFSNQLRIPRKFIRNFKEKLSETISLRGPSGNVWTVKLARTVDDVLFKTGWETFVRDNRLAETDFLVFRYDRNSSFRVTIFDGSGCEREGSYFVKKHTSFCSNEGCIIQRKDRNDPADPRQVVDLCETDEENGQQEGVNMGRKNRSVRSVCKRQVSVLELKDTSDEDSLSLWDSSEDWGPSWTEKQIFENEGESETLSDVQIRSSKVGRKKKMEVNNAGHFGSGKFKQTRDEDSEESTNASEARSCDHGKGKRIRYKDNKDITHGRHTLLRFTEERVGGDIVITPDQARTYSSYFISHRREVTKEEKQRAYSLAAKYSSPSPSVMVLMKPTYVQKQFFLNIPKEWARKHISHSEEELKIQLCFSK